MDIAPHRLAVGSQQLELAKLVVHLARARIPSEFESAHMLDRDRFGRGRIATKAPQAETPAAGPLLDEVRLRVWVRLLIIWRHQIRSAAARRRSPPASREPSGPDS